MTNYHTGPHGTTCSTDLGHFGTGPTKYRIGHIGRIGIQSVACCSGFGAALHLHA